MQLADLVFVAVMGGFFLLSWAFVRLCERV
jgi:hypothetical protein